ncbi:MAG: S46 family peptidase [candidate division Zixibacteria bacterium]|nr:S46 family peptidase [candidate division Zixibacteria bacterium]
MRKTVVFLAFALALVGMTVSVSQADEGMWPLFSLDQLNFENLAARGLKLKAADIYNPDGTGLWAAVVSLGGGTGSFVSPNGLIITNHRVAFGSIQSQSTAENNYIDKGFLARTQADEIPATGYNAWVCKSFDDVTKQVLGAVKSKATDLERYKAVEKATKEIIAKAEKGKDVKCRVAAFDEGRQYILITFLPDCKCAEYSKDIVPYKSAIYLPVSAAQLKEGDFDMTIGYPGGTSRFETSFGIDEALNFSYPRSVATRKVLIDIMEKASAENPEWSVRLSSRIKGLANYLKNFEAMITGLTRSHVVEQKVQLELKLADALQQNPALQARYGHVLPDLKALYEKHGKTRLKDEALGWLGQSSRYFGFANQLYRWSLQKAKKDMDRDPEFMERNVPSMRRGLKEAQVNLVPEVDKRMFTYVLHHAMALPADQRIAALDKLVGDTTKVGTDKAIETLVERLYSNTKLGTLDDRMKMFEMSNKELLAQNDAFIGLAASMYDDLEARRQQGKEFDGAQRRLNPQMIAAFRELKLGPAYPDANGTMRLTYGSIKGF